MLKDLSTETSKEENPETTVFVGPMGFGPTNRGTNGHFRTPERTRALVIGGSTLIGHKKLSVEAEATA
jgi:hypothetical protein